MDADSVTVGDGSGAVPADCNGCRELTIEVMSAQGLVVGTYSMEADNVSGRTARGTYSPDLSGTVEFWSDGSDPEDQPWQGQIVITAASASEISGTFTFTGYAPLEPGPIRSSVEIGEGVFRVRSN